ncbi:centriolin isoform X1, partial [Paramuricea clavata]
MEKAGNEGMKSISPGNGGHFTSRKLPQINTGDGDHGMLELNHDGINHSSIDHTDKQFEKDTKTLEDVPRDSGSVAYISETLIKQITKEEKLDLITSLTIHFPKDKLNKKIKYIENLEKLKRLQTLNLSNNMIEKMQKLETVTELRELNLSRNCIKVIECLDNMAKLEVLNLSGNQITSIPRPTMKKIRNLKVLKLSHNKLES